MIILDTNVFSALLKATPDQQVIQWLNRLNPTLIYTTTITIYEMRYGIERLVTGKKKQQLNDAFEQMLQDHFTSKILHFDKEAAYAAGEIAASVKSQGYNIGSHDVQISGIAQNNEAIIATRNQKDFPMNDTINPWG